RGRGVPLLRRDRGASRQVAGRPPAAVRRGRDLRLVLRARGGLGRGAAAGSTRSAGGRRGRAGAAEAAGVPAAPPAAGIGPIATVPSANHSSPIPSASRLSSWQNSVDEIQ